jgi:hypothetical protein
MYKERRAVSLHKETLGNLYKVLAAMGSIQPNLKMVRGWKSSRPHVSSLGCNADSVSTKGMESALTVMRNGSGQLRGYVLMFKRPDETSRQSECARSVHMADKSIDLVETETATGTISLSGRADPSMSIAMLPWLMAFLRGGLICGVVVVHRAMDMCIKTHGCMEAARQ